MTLSRRFIHDTIIILDTLIQRAVSVLPPGSEPILDLANINPEVLDWVRRSVQILRTLKAIFMNEIDLLDEQNSLTEDIFDETL